jgi:hypothetical protein
MIISPYHISSELIRKRDSSSKESSGTVSVLVEGRSHINSAKTKDFFDLACSNSKSNSWRMTIHLEYSPPQQLLSKDMLHGVAIGNDWGSA